MEGFWGGSGGVWEVLRRFGGPWGGSDCPVPPRYPKVVVDEGLRAVREWLEAATPEEESE